MDVFTNNCSNREQISISEHSKGTHNGRRMVAMRDVEMPKVLVSMLMVLQILFRLLLAQSFSTCIIGNDSFMFGETIS